jgi:GNAT superfamily N-acetyltransferase
VLFLLGWGGAPCCVPPLNRGVRRHLSVAVRPAKESDADALYGLVSLFPTPTPSSRANFDSALLRILQDGNACVAVASNGTRLIGYVSGSCHPTFYANGPMAWVDELLVREEHRRGGHGRALISFFENWARSAGCPVVGLATAGATDFYNRLGYASKAGYFKRYLGEA